MRRQISYRPVRWRELVSLGLLLVAGPWEPSHGTAADRPALARKSLPQDRSFEALFGPNRRYRYFDNAAAFPFRPGARQFDLANAWWLAEASLLTYVDDTSFVAEQLQRAGLNQVQIFRSPPASSHDTQGLIACHDRFVIVAMRGTEPGQLRDFLTDLNLLPAAAEGGGRVHAGFQSALHDVWPRMKTQLDRLAGEGRTIWFTGHSLGGALAVLAADRFGKAAGVYTFGAPRVGDAEFRARYRQPTYRVVNHSDLVTELPPPGFYCHVGELKYFGSDHRLSDGIEPRDLIQDRAQGQLNAVFKRLNDWTAGRFDAAVPQALEDHAPVCYATHCWNQLLDLRGLGKGAVSNEPDGLQSKDCCRLAW